MKRIAFAFLSVLLCAAFILTPASAQNSGNVTGDYAIQITGENFIIGTLHLSQVGDTIIGSAKAAEGGGIVQMEGTLSGDKMSGKWRGPTNNGWITVNFNASMTAFSGEYGPPGKKSSGKFVARMLQRTAF